MKNDAFTDAPPEGFLAFNQKVTLGIASLLKGYGVELEDIPHFIGAYWCISQGKRGPSKDESLDSYWDMDDALVDSVLSYINRVQARREEAQIETE